ncbi:MBL fold metallo-hydrolase [Streptococcus saliviloxodontae]|uniref:Glyoxylase-like metal-dependent hydrolase (Beta-lactamase superfamily II) n=1 Tax=Streptococcus saliviloxodontae TaxID=1349416 RepID=A0ABS2PN79_9STRE|nr:MBL fold metallo-hydrolase [Streptococcus saliviloxodontae]MBM7636892.1 glyoxylase-like metal-dependent hydrolase (beta-lactamase superfamily II) [Streptococcus saliviloxodontae]
MTMTSNTFNNVTIHTYTAPENGALVNTHIIETEAHVIVVDTQFILPYAQEVKAFVEGLNKPIDKIIISHGHPDHWFGTAVFEGESVYAIQEVLDEIQETGQAAIERNKPVLGDLIPDKALVPTLVLEEGDFSIDGVTIRVTKVADTESGFITTLELVEEGVIITQDIVYNGVHLFVAQQQLENWKAVLADLNNRDWKLVLPGHGLPATQAVFKDMTDYLTLAEKTLAEVETFREYKETVMTHFPEHKGEVLIDLNEPFLGLK